MTAALTLALRCCACELCDVQSGRVCSGRWPTALLRADGWSSSCVGDAPRVYCSSRSTSGRTRPACCRALQRPFVHRSGQRGADTSWSALGGTRPSELAPRREPRFVLIRASCAHTVAANGRQPTDSGQWSSNGRGGLVASCQQRSQTGGSAARLRAQWPQRYPVGVTTEQ